MLHRVQPSCLTPILAKVLEMPEPIFIDQVIAQVAQLGRVNHTVTPV